MRTLKILVVDDEALVSGAARMTLERLGHEVTVVNSGEQALGLLQQGGDALKLDLILIDLQMEGIDGIQTIRLAKKIVHSDTVFWLWTSDVAGKVIVDAYEAGAVLVIAKPVGYHQFVDLIKAGFAHLQ